MRIAALKLLLAAVAIAGATAFLHEYRVKVPSARGRASTLCVPSPPEVAVIEQRLRVKSQLTQRVIAERTPLLEAAELFDQVNGEDGRANLVLVVPGRSIREKLCRQVILYITSAEETKKLEGHDYPEPRLSEEYRAELERRIAAGEFPPEPGM